MSGISYGLGSMIPVSILINRWFDQHRAAGTEHLRFGQRVATIVLPPVTTHLVERFSMSAAFRMGGAAILVCAGVVLLVLRNDPREKGLRPCGQTEIPPEAPATAVSPSQGALGRRTWILLGCASLFMGAVANPGFSHLSVLYTTEGFAPATVALMISGTGVMITVGKLLYGDDHRPDRRAGVLPAVWRGSAGWASAVLFGLCPEYGTQRGHGLRSLRTPAAARPLRHEDARGGG